MVELIGLFCPGKKCILFSTQVLSLVRRCFLSIQSEPSTIFASHGSFLNRAWGVNFGRSTLFFSLETVIIATQPQRGTYCDATGVFSGAQVTLQKYWVSLLL